METEKMIAPNVEGGLAARGEAQTPKNEVSPLAQILRRENQLVDLLKKRPEGLARPSAPLGGHAAPLGANSIGAEWEWFSQMARLLMGSYTLVAGSNVGDILAARFDIIELEAYLWCAGHEDPYVHRNPQQTNTCGEWYFHREKAAKIGFTLKGLDLTFGEPGKEAGGLLIRTIMDQATGEFIEGPSKVVDRILLAASVTCVAELKQLPGPAGSRLFRSNAFDTAGILHIEPRAARSQVEIPDGQIKAGPRVGLSEKDAHYQQAPYRFHARPDRAKKDKTKITAGISVPARLAQQTKTGAPSEEEQRLVEAYLGELLG